MVYHYVNPLTQEHVASLLPPDHPAMICLQSGEHVKHTKFGVLGQLSNLVSMTHILSHTSQVSLLRCYGSLLALACASLTAR